LVASFMLAMVLGASQRVWVKSLDDQTSPRRWGAL
jgi:hypothetical protein